LLQAARFSSLSRRMGDDHLQRMAGTECAPTQRRVTQCQRNYSWEERARR
jgi:hypothetical protein